MPRAPHVIVSAPVHARLAWQEIDGYLDRALDLSPAERERWLAELTTSEPGIARVLRQLLAERDAGEVWLARRSDGRFEAQCAIKFLDDAFSQDKLAERFRLQSGLPYSQRTGRAWLLLGRALQQLGQSKPVDEALALAVTHLSNTVEETHPSLIEARALSGQRLKP